MYDLVISAAFYLFASLGLFAALMVIIQNNPVRSVLFLVLTFFATAVLWILASAEFLALILILVYVGAVMTLFLFVVMMLNIDLESRKAHLTKYLPLGLILVSVLVSLMLLTLPKDFVQNPPIINKSLLGKTNEAQLKNTNQQFAKLKLSNTEQIGMVLYTEYVLAFEMAAVILLIAIIAAITLTHRDAMRSKRQDIKKQLMVNPKDRIKLINMEAEAE